MSDREAEHGGYKTAFGEALVVAITRVNRGVKANPLVLVLWPVHGRGFSTEGCAVRSGMWRAIGSSACTQ